MLTLKAGYPVLKPHNGGRKKKKHGTLTERVPQYLPPMCFKTQNMPSKLLHISTHNSALDKESKLWTSMMLKSSFEPVQSMKLPTLFEGSYCQKLRNSHHHRLVPSILDPPKLRRLGSGLMPPVVVDSAILTDLMVISNYVRCFCLLGLLIFRSNIHVSRSKY